MRECARRLAREGRDVAAFGCDADGRPDVEALAQAAADERPLLVSCGWANGETGHVVDPIELRRALGPHPLLHVDGAQAFGRIAPTAAAAADLLSLSSHKLGGPAGVGALVVGPRARKRLVGTIVGGEHEDRLRAGTENVAAIVGFAVAARLAEDERGAETARLAALRERLWTALERVPGDLVRITPDDGLANTLTVAANGVSSAALVAGLDLAGFAVSTGSACAAAAPEPSPILAALGVDARYRNGVLRMSMGRTSTEAGVDALAGAFATVVERAREAA